MLYLYLSNFIYDIMNIEKELIFMKHKMLYLFLVLITGGLIHKRNSNKNLILSGRYQSQYKILTFTPDHKYYYVDQKSKQHSSGSIKSLKNNSYLLKNGIFDNIKIQKKFNDISFIYQDQSCQYYPTLNTLDDLELSLFIR